MKLCLFGIIPKVRGKGFFFLILNFYFFGINVKDTALRRPGVPLHLYIARCLSYTRFLQK
jgi:hypothetical protein